MQVAAARRRRADQFDRVDLDHDRVVSTQVWNPSAGPDGFTFAPGATSSIFFVVDTACPSFLVAAVTFHQ